MLHKTQDGYLTPVLQCRICHGADAFRKIIPHHASQGNYIKTNQKQRYPMPSDCLNTVMYTSCFNWNIRVEEVGKGKQHFMIDV